jgi:hypothetical protein
MQVSVETLIVCRGEVCDTDDNMIEYAAVFPHLIIPSICLWQKCS